MIHLNVSPDHKIPFHIFRHDTFRVFANLQDDSPLSSKTSYDSHYIGHTFKPAQQSVMSGQNKPHPTNVTFLRQNPRFICEPICYVKTSMKPPVIYPSWWPDEVPEQQTKVPERSSDSTSRTDYPPPPIPHDQITRYSSNLAMQVTPAGIFHQGPHKSGVHTPKIVEKISYEHQFNSRLDPSHPVRGRRHGSFIWKVISDVGRPGRKNSKPVEYAYIKVDPSESTVTSEVTCAENADQQRQTKDLMPESEETQSTSNEG